jgi:hypothetical protein
MPTATAALTDIPPATPTDALTSTQAGTPAAAPEATSVAVVFGG